MSALILTWHPVNTPWSEADYSKVVEATAKGRRPGSNWSTGVRTGGVAIGDRAYLFRQFESRGIVASAIVTSTVYPDKHWRDRRRKANYIDLEWDRVVQVADRLPISDLESELPEFSWIHLQGSGIRLTEPLGARLGRLWAGHLGDIPFRSPEEVDQEQFPEGAVQRVEVNRYERNPKARQACLDHWGAVCSVCGFDFGAAYGPIGDGYIHVHHLVDIAAVGESYEIDPVKDLRPVCPNCHAMLHQQRPAMSIASLKARMARRRSLLTPGVSRPARNP